MRILVEYFLWPACDELGYTALDAMAVSLDCDFVPAGVEHTNARLWDFAGFTVFFGVN